MGVMFGECDLPSFLVGMREMRAYPAFPVPGLVRATDLAPAKTFAAKPDRLEFLAEKGVFVIALDSRE